MLSSRIFPPSDGCVHLKLFLFALLSKSTLCVVFSGLDEIEYCHKVDDAVEFVLEGVLCLVAACYDVGV